ncbi:MAG: aminotransferase class IV family protein [Deltaproteobacteria bacterium]|nr:aminotransferase class IV family protein [Deltaproteobacteria bacterium]
MPCSWINGKLVDESKAVLSIFDRSYLYGEGIFETLRCYGGKPAFLDRHYQRLRQNSRRLQIPLTLSEKDLRFAIGRLLKKNKMKEAVVRATVSLQGATFGVEIPKDPKVNLTLFCRPAALDPRLFEAGVKVFCSQNLINDSPGVADIKATSYLTKMLARAEAAKAGAYETLLKNAKGNWAEGSRTNLFVVLDRTVITPPLSEGILNGITRQVVLEILKEKKMAHREAPITDLMLNNAEEIFLTGSTSEVMPVGEVIGMIIRKTGPFPLAKTLRLEYRRTLGI